MNYTATLVGQQLLSLENTDYTWSFNFSGDVVVATESLWRLITEERIIVTSEDHGHPFGLPEPVDARSRVLSSVLNRLVETASIHSPSGDLTLEFIGNIRLQFLQTSCGYESWRLNAPGSETICRGGGKIAHSPTP